MTRGAAAARRARVPLVGRRRPFDLATRAGLAACSTNWPPGEQALVGDNLHLYAELVVRGPCPCRCTRPWGVEGVDRRTRRLIPLIGACSGLASVGKAMFLGCTVTPSRSCRGAAILRASVDDLVKPASELIASLVSSCFFGRIVFSDAASQLAGRGNQESEIARFQPVKSLNLAIQNLPQRPKQIRLQPLSRCSRTTTELENARPPQTQSARGWQESVRH